MQNLPRCDMAFARRWLAITHCICTYIQRKPFFFSIVIVTTVLFKTTWKFACVCCLASALSSLEGFQLEITPLTTDGINHCLTFDLSKAKITEQDFFDDVSTCN